VNIPLFMLFLTLLTGNGLVLYAFYSGCDPLRQGRVQKPDQVRLSMLKINKTKQAERIA